MADRFTEQVGRVMDLAREKADRFGHPYVRPEHLLLGLLRDGSNQPAGMLQARGVDLAAARAALRRLADRGVVPGARPSDAELLGTLGIDLEAIRRDTEQSFGVQACGTRWREATRARRGGVGRVPRTPLEGPAVLTTQATWLASRRAEALGYDAVGPELLLLGALEDVRTPWPRCMSNPWVRQLKASVAYKPAGDRSRLEPGQYASGLCRGSRPLADGGAPDLGGPWAGEPGWPDSAVGVGVLAVGGGGRTGIGRPQGSASGQLAYKAPGRWWEGSGSRRDHHHKIITVVGEPGSHHEGRSPARRRLTSLGRWDGAR